MTQPNTGTRSVLVVDDNREVLTAIRLLLKDHVDTVHTATDPASLPALLQDMRYGAILLDMNFSQGDESGQEGFRWLERIRQLDPQAVVIMITAYGDIDRAVRAMKAGASDFIVKPWQNETLRAAVLAALRRRVAPAPAARGPGSRAAAGPYDRRSGRFGAMLGTGPPMQRVFDTIEKVAATDANVLILGEHGTGKELVARSLHEHSRRADAPFLSVDLGALSESLFESELFGHVKGAFTGADRDRPGRFEEASGGTLFLDEIGNVPPALQRKLLTVLERREVTRVGATAKVPVDIRLVCATNMPIYEMARRSHPGDEAPTFREDLLYRINTVEIHLPPLRDRREDIPLLAQHYLQQFAEKYDRPAHALSPAAVDALQAYAWPGNVRELKHTMERTVILSDTEVLQPSDFYFSAAGPPAEAGALAFDSLDLEEIEHTAIRKALSKHGGNISRAAEELGLTRRSLYRRIEKYGL